MEELEKFITYLIINKFYVIIVICLLKYKFRLRIGSLANSKVRDLLSNNIIIFKEKNQKITKRILLPRISNILRGLIKECELNPDNYFFYYYKFVNHDCKRCQFFISEMRKLYHQSNCFSIATTESLSSHIFRATYSVNKFKNNPIIYKKN